MAAEQRRLYVSRRRFVQGASLAGLGLLARCGRLPGQSPPRVPRIGVLSPYAAHDASAVAMVEPLREGVRERGYLERQNVAMAYRYSGGQNDLLPALAADLVGRDVDVIVADKHDAILAAKQATTTIPIVIDHARRSRG
jgi:putative tryptophan/tyrosine transport system substrate-binding protein